MINWRIYRDADQAPVPVAEARVRVQYSFTPVIDSTTRSTTVVPYDEAWGLYTGHTFESGNTLPMESMYEEPILLDPTDPDPQGRTYRLAARQRRPEHPTLLDMPRVVRQPGALVIPGFEGNEPIWVTQGQPLGRGVFQVAPGYRSVHKLLIGGAEDYGQFDLDPIHGVLFIQDNNGDPVRPQADVEVHLTGSMRKDISRLPSGDTTIADPRRPGHLGVLHKSVHRSYEDARRLPVPSQEGRLHATDHAYYDGHPMATDQLWVVTTSADPERVDEAMARTFPAGTMYRQEGHGTMTNPDVSSDDGDQKFQWNEVQ